MHHSRQQSLVAEWLGHSITVRVRVRVRARTREWDFSVLFFLSVLRPAFSRSTNLESKLIEFFVFVNI